MHTLTGLLDRAIDASAALRPDLPVSRNACTPL
jgi:hypothetical protein